MKIQLLDNAKKKRFIEEVSYLGVEKIPQLLVKTGKEKIFAFSGSLSKDEILKIWRMFPIEGIGLYFGKEIIDKRTGKKESRLSLDALHVLKNQIKKNIVELDKNQEEHWFKGNNLEGDFLFSGFAAVKDNENDFIGTGKISEDKKTIFNFLPKERRRRN